MGASRGDKEKGHGRGMTEQKIIATSKGEKGGGSEGSALRAKGSAEREKCELDLGEVQEHQSQFSSSCMTASAGAVSI